MASWFTRALDKITPWDRGGEVQRRQERKKKDEERQVQRSQAPSVFTPTRNIGQQPQNDNKVDVQRPENLFRDLNKSLALPGTPGVVSVQRDQDIVPVKKPEPGSVVQPNDQRAPLPDQEFKTINDKAVENKKLFGMNMAWALPKKFEKVTRVKVEGEYQTNKDKFVSDFDKLDRERREIYLRGIREQAKNKVDEQGREIPNSGDRAAINSLRELEAAGRAGSQRDIVQRTADAISVPGRSIVRVATGAAQGGAGLYDLATPGKGNNRVSSFLDQVAKNQDKSADEAGVGTAYRTVNVPTEIASYFIPSTLATKLASRIPKATRLTEEIVDFAARNVDNAGEADRVRRFLADRMRKGWTLEQALEESAQSAKYMGENASKGNDTSATSVGTDILTALGGSLLFPGNRIRRAGQPQDVVDDIPAPRSEPRPIPVGQNIPVQDVGAAVDVPVRVDTPQGQLIRELAGDAAVPARIPTPQEVAERRIVDSFNAQPQARPDMRVEGIERRVDEPFRVNPTEAVTNENTLIDQYAEMLRGLGEGNGVAITPDGRRVSNNFRTSETAGKRMTKADWREEAERQLRSGQAEPSLQKAFDEVADPEVQSLLARGDTTEDLPPGRPIEIKEAKGIPVRDETVVPANLPETPGQVRVTEATAPMAAKTKAVASEPVVANTPELPREVQEVLDNPTRFDKRQVAAARNQRKLARQMAKTQEETVEAMQRIEASNPRNVAGQPEGYAPTGQFARGKKGNAYQTASRSSEAAAGEAEMATRSVDDLITEIGGKESFTPGDRRRIQAALENVARSNPNDTETRMILRKLQSKSRTELAQGLAMWPRVVRRSASADTLTNRWEGKIARALDNPAKMTDADFAEVQRANDAFTLARDSAEQLNEQFKRTGSEADFKAWEKAYNAARKADEDAKFTEVAVAKRVLKGEKGSSVNKVLDELKKESGVNTMDLVTANMLSGTATGFRNTFGTELAGVENRLFANTRAKVASALFGEDVGGYSRKGARLGRKIGIVKLGRDMKRRAEIGGKNPLEWAKNWSTTINSGGESSLQSQVYSRLGKYYENQFKGQGISGKELDMRMRHAILTDPDGMGETYLDAAMKSSGLTGLFEKGQTIEKAVTDYVGRQTDNKLAQGASKLIMRLAVGFPTATGNFMYQSAKRLSLGLPSYLEMGAKMMRGDKMGAAQAFDRALKETGSGAAVLGIGAALGKAGAISGSYPDDPDERARWEREGISENSIKIGGAWYPIPQGAGMLGLPLMVGAAIGREGDSDDSVKELFSPKNLAKLMPTDQIQGFLNMASGDGAPQDFKNFVASGIRAVTPVGALLSQIAKSTDDIKNDTTTKSLGENIIDQVLSGIPVVNNSMDIPNKTDDGANPIQNPNPLQLAFGATSASQTAGEERSAQIQAGIDDSIKGIDQYGLLNDPNMEGVLEGKGLEALTKLNSGKRLDESDIKALKEGLVKGVSAEGTDTAYLERGEYDTNLAVLKLKRDLMKEDKTTKPSSLQDIELAIKRGEVYKDNQIPYEMISEYKSVGVDDWRKMGDPESDEYDPEMYQMLWDIDQLMTGAGVSYRKGKLDKQKYYEKESKAGGRSSRGGSNFSPEFGRLRGGDFAPQVQQYETIDQRSGGVPVIRVQRPNIVHKIGSSG